MTNLSPQAQAIVDAAFPAYDEENLYFLTGEQHTGKIVSAALRVLADNVAPENYACFSGHREWDEALETRNESIREAILDIATELEAL